MLNVKAREGREVREAPSRHCFPHSAHPPPCLPPPVCLLAAVVACSPLSPRPLPTPVIRLGRLSCLSSLEHSMVAESHTGDRRSWERWWEWQGEDTGKYHEMSSLAGIHEVYRKEERGQGRWSLPDDCQIEYRVWMLKSSCSQVT